jgi:hypothetical protein
LDATPSPTAHEAKSHPLAQFLETNLISVLANNESGESARQAIIQKRLVE